ncbi:unnamed protein product [Trifolium pratense]|uniref:Uncharacterized protein n=1 Tax=Trifolium pratense TaxID=57577 RepID=A0ACB0KEU3_TRIPR|nr:unnamed protein product [Trifolium pratense]
MASGSSGRGGNPGSKGFDFASDDILCSYDDFSNRDSNSNGNHTDSTKDFQKSRVARTSVFPATGYNPPEDSLSQDVIATVDKSMKKYTDNLMRFLEGISSRLSQLELYCYNLDKSIGEIRSDINRDHGEQDSKLKSLEKHVQEVHRSVQILRDKQELAETQKELAKLQLAQKESSSSSHSQSNEDRSTPSTTDPKKTDNASDANNHQLALALPHQIAPQLPPAGPPPQAQPPNVNQPTQQPAYYMQAAPTPSQLPQNQYMPSDQQYRTPQLQQDMSRVAQQSTPSQINPPTSVQQFSQYQQQQQQQPWPQQVQQSSMQPQMRPLSPAVYPPYQPNQTSNPSPTETLPNSMPMQMPYSGVPQPGSSRTDSMQYGYGGTGRTVPQQPPPQQIKGSFSSQPSDAYGASGTHTPPGNAYMMYDGGEGGRTQHPPPQPSHFAQSGYPPTGASLQNPNLMVRNPSQSQFARNHPYNELIEKLVSMGFRGDHVVSVIQRMEESGQTVDFNSILDRLNGPQRGWSG